MELSKVKLRTYQEDDFPEVVQLIHSTIKTIYPEYYPDEVVNFFLSYHSVDELRKRISFKKTTVLIVELENEIIGCGYLRKQEIGAVYVKNKLQCSGIGSMIVKGLIDLAKSKNHDHIWLDATIGAREFYLKMGFQLIENKTEYVENNTALDYHRMFMKL